jgi:hypothetical protein
MTVTDHASGRHGLADLRLGQILGPRGAAGPVACHAPPPGLHFAGGPGSGPYSDPVASWRPGREPARAGRPLWPRARCRPRAGGPWDQRAPTGWPGGARRRRRGEGRSMGQTTKMETRPGHWHVLWLALTPPSIRPGCSRPAGPTNFNAKAVRGSQRNRTIPTVVPSLCMGRRAAPLRRSRTRVAGELGLRVFLARSAQLRVFSGVRG